MKWMVLSMMILAGSVAEAQVTFRNSFIIGRHQKSKTKFSTLAMNVGLIAVYAFTRQSAPGNVNGFNVNRSYRNVVIDLYAINHPEKVYTYSELATKVYGEPSYVQPFRETVPLFLTMPPPIELPVYKGTLNLRRL